MSQHNNNNSSITDYNPKDCIPTQTKFCFPEITTFGMPEPVVFGEIDNTPETQEPEKIPASDFLEDAGKQMKQRAQLRDQPQGERSMARIVETFNALTGHNLTESEGWEFLVLLKMVRGRQGKFNKDDYTDGAAYFALLGECESKNLCRRGD